jgi:hypothetical protein
MIFFQVNKSHKTYVEIFSMQEKLNFGKTNFKNKFQKEVHYG